MVVIEVAGQRRSEGEGESGLLKVVVQLRQLKFAPIGVVDHAGRGIEGRRRRGWASVVVEKSWERAGEGGLCLCYVCVCAGEIRGQKRGRLGCVSMYIAVCV